MLYLHIHINYNYINFHYNCIFPVYSQGYKKTKCV